MSSIAEQAEAPAGISVQVGHADFAKLWWTKAGVNLEVGVRQAVELGDTVTVREIKAEKKFGRMPTVRFTGRYIRCEALSPAPAAGGVVVLKPVPGGHFAPEAMRGQSSVPSPQSSMNVTCSACGREDAACDCRFDDTYDRMVL